MMGTAPGASAAAASASKPPASNPLVSSLPAGNPLANRNATDADYTALNDVIAGVSYNASQRSTLWIGQTPIPESLQRVRVDTTRLVVEGKRRAARGADESVTVRLEQTS
jgi:hypothetical protein